MHECDWWKTYNTDIIVKRHLRESFPTKSLSEERLLENIKPGSLFGYVQFDIEVPENLQENVANFPPIFKNINVSRDDNGPLMKEYTEEEVFLTQPRRMLIPSYFLENGTIITPLLVYRFEQ